MTPSRSTFHRICGDRPLGRGERWLYARSVLLERIGERLGGAGVPVEIFAPTIDREAFVSRFGEAAADYSASRILCLVFLMAQAETVFRAGDAVLDVGCGTGRYVPILRRGFGVGDYRGVDIAVHPEWTAIGDERTRFAQAELGVEPVDASGADVVFSQSVLEHVAHDRAMFSLFRSNPARTVRHVHLVPATATWQIYRYHGYRRYQPGSIARLLASPGVRAPRVFAFGNRTTRLLHLDHYDHLGGRPIGRRASGYDPAMPMIDNLAAHARDIVPSRVADADFFAILFEQALGPDGPG